MALDSIYMGLPTRANDESGYDVNDEASPYLRMDIVESFNASLNLLDPGTIIGTPEDYADNDGLLQLLPASPITEASEVLSVASTAKIRSGSSSQSHSAVSSAATLPIHPRSKSQIKPRSGDLITAGKKRPGRPIQLKHENGFDTSTSLAAIVESREDVGGMADFSGQIALISNKQKNVTSILCTIFKTVELYRCLLSCGAADAQKILDGFQLLLDTEIFPDRGQLIAAMRRLSGRTQRYPSRFFPSRSLAIC
ncbi:hypothetical protein H2248_008192 [Termitomyces sp. 'cryptogamus']|nr:hypothetical protein H2248_008192 [Termitomyces sp. 'cryptogamus']